MTSTGYTDKLLSSLIVVAVALGVLLAFVLGQPKLALLGMSITGTPLLFASYLIFRGNSDYSCNHQISVIDNLPKIVDVVFILGCTALIIQLHLFSYRRLSFFILASIIYILPLLRIYYNPNAEVLTSVFQSCLLLLILAYSITLNLPLFYGGTDILPHMNAISYILYTGEIIPPQISNYSNFPLYHVFSAVFINISGLDVRSGLFILTGSVFSISPLILYIISYKLLDDSRLSGVAAILYSSSPIIVYSSSYVVTRHMAFIGFLFIFWILLDGRFKSGYGRSISLMIMTLYLLLVHQVSFIQILFLLTVIWSISYYFGNGHEFVTRREMTIFICVFIGYWIFAAEELISWIISTQLLGNSLNSSFSGVASGSTGFHIIEYINAYILTILLFLGISVGLSSKKKRLFQLSIFLIPCSIFIIYSPVHVFSRLATFRFDRLMLLLTPFASIFMALGLQKFSKQNLFSGEELHTCVVMILIVLFTFTSITGGIYHDTAADSPDIEWASPPEHFVESELEAFEHSKTIPKDSSVHTDYHSYRYINSFPFDGDISEMNPAYNTNVITGPDDSPDGYIIFRENRLEEDGLYLGEFPNVYHYNRSISYSTYDRVYSNGDSSILKSQNNGVN